MFGECDTRASWPLDPSMRLDLWLALHFPGVTEVTFVKGSGYLDGQINTVKLTHHFQKLAIRIWYFQK